MTVLSALVKFSFVLSPWVYVARAATNSLLSFAEVRVYRCNLSGRLGFLSL
jgi:hypothetical protein